MRFYTARSDKKTKCNTCKTDILRGEDYILVIFPGLVFPLTFHAGYGCYLKWVEKKYNEQYFKWKDTVKGGKTELKKMGRPVKYSNPKSAVAINRLKTSIRYHERIGGHEDRITELQRRLDYEVRKKQAGWA
jgi:hypothetical protein